MEEKNKNDILLVEDNASDASLTIMALKEKHLANNIVHVRDGQEALDYIFAEGAFSGRNAEDLPSVILLDLKMPKVTGIEVLQKIKSDERFKTIPVVVFSSSQEDPDVKTCYELGVNSYIVKPLEFEEFMKVASELGLYWMLINHLPE